MISPDYAGGSLVNLMGTMERNLTGASLSPPLRQELVPEARSYIVVLFDGLGDLQLSHTDAASLADSRQGAVDSVFPTTTTSALASIATGLPPARHGLLGYEIWLPHVGHMINTIHWTPVGGGDVVDVDFDAFLPAPTLWERLASAGIEPITVQPSEFQGTPLSRVLYRGARYEPVDTYEDWIEAATSLAAEPRRMVFAYLGAVDVAAHLKGQSSAEYAGAIRLAAALWGRLEAKTPDGAVLVGTADHGHVDVTNKIELDKDLCRQSMAHGGGRVMFVRGDTEVVRAASSALPATFASRSDLEALFGAGELHPRFDERAPSGALIADEGVRLLHPHSDKRLIGAHGGLTEAERRVPVLVGGA